MVRVEFTDNEAAFLVQLLNSVAGNDDLVSVMKERLQRTDNDRRFDHCLSYWRKRLTGTVEVSKT